MITNEEWKKDAKKEFIRTFKENLIKKGINELSTWSSILENGFTRVIRNKMLSDGYLSYDEWKDKPYRDSYEVRWNKLRVFLQSAWGNTKNGTTIELINSILDMMTLLELEDRDNV